MAYINKVVDKVYVINLDKDKERFDKISENLKSQNIKFTRFPAVLGSKIKNHEYLTESCCEYCTDGIKGCGLSHKFIWEDMIKNNYSSVLILEDDAIITPNFNEILEKGWSQVPKDFDIFYLGCNFKCSDSYTVPIVVNKILGHTPTKVGDNVLSVSGSVGAHGYIITNNCAKFFQGKLINTHIDFQMQLWINEYDLSAYSITPTIVNTPIYEHDNGSNLSESFPYLLNGLVRKIPISDSITFDWALSENFMKVGAININMLMVLLFISVFFAPFKWSFIFYAWLLVEYIYSYDNKNAFKYFIVLCFGLGIKYSASLGIDYFALFNTKNIYKQIKILKNKL